MFSAGDVQSCLRKVEALLRAIKYSGNVSYDGLSKGDPSAFLPIMSFTLTSFSPPFAEQLIAAGLELSGKTDLRFTDTLYKVLRDFFHYKPVLTKQQFLQTGFSGRKLSFLCDVINMVLHQQRKLNKPRVRYPTSNRDVRVDVHPSQTDAEIVSKKKNWSTFTINPSHTEASSHPHGPCESDVQFHSYEDVCGHETKQLLEEEEPEEENFWASEVEGRLSALEAQIQSLQSEFRRLNDLEKRVEELEICRKTEKNDGQVVVISRESWENLMSRVLLLETKLELSSTGFVSFPTQTSTSSTPSISDPSQEALTGQLQRITSMLRSTSDLLKNSESCDTSSKS